ncbi:MAG: nitrilase-related carbon-nitrogen hydrolase [Ignavibacteria bacterium]
MKAGYLQFKPEFGKPKENISRIEELIADKNFDLLVLPELPNSGYLFSSEDELKELSEEIPDGEFCKSLKKLCSAKDCFIVSGICEKSNGKFYNSAVLVYPDGNINVYRKLHLFFEEKLWFAPGDTPLVVYEISNSNVRNVKIGIMVCFDWRFPEITRTLALKGAQIICHPSNLVMPHCQDAMVIRALENQVFTITANRIGKDIKRDKELSFTGKSIIVSPNGDILHIGSEDTEECFITEIDPDIALNKMITEYNNIFEDRREELYFK